MTACRLGRSGYTTDSASLAALRKSATRPSKSRYGEVSDGSPAVLTKYLLSAVWTPYEMLPESCVSVPKRVKMVPVVRSQSAGWSSTAWGNTWLTLVTPSTIERPSFRRNDGTG